MADHQIIGEAMAGNVICNTGQVDKATARALDRLVKSGTLAKWRGFWFPVAGAQHGIGPLKTCWGLPAIKQQFCQVNPKVRHG